VAKRDPNDRNGCKKAPKNRRMTWGTGSNRGLKTERIERQACETIREGVGKKKQETQPEKGPKKNGYGFRRGEKGQLAGNQSSTKKGKTGQEGGLIAKRKEKKRQEGHGRLVPRILLLGKWVLG